MERQDRHLEEAIEVSVGMGRSPRAVHHVDLGQRERDFLRELFDGLVDWSVLQLGVFVEERRDEGGVEKHHHHAHDEEEDPHIEVEVRPPEVDDPNHAGEDGRADHKAQSQ